MAPGFIDIHAHSDLTRLRYPDAATRVLQGVTTEVIGNCGLTPFPLPPGNRGAFRAVIGPIDVAPDVDLAWTEHGRLPRRARGGARGDQPGPAGRARQHPLRGARFKPSRSDERELNLMAALLRDALEAGCWGMSLGLMYAPGELSDRGELLRLARELAARGALLTAHMRAYDAERLPAAVDEVVSLAAAAGTGLEISHLRSLRDPDGSGLERAIALIEAAADVEADAYPYLAGAHHPAATAAGAPARPGDSGHRRRLAPPR